MSEDWLSRWEQGRIGWHEADGNALLKTHWPPLAAGSRVLVPMCGKARDLLWLESLGLQVTGVELSPIAVQAFFAEAGLSFDTTHRGDHRHFAARDRKVTIVQGDYFEFRDEPFDGLYDRAAFVAVPPEVRARYAHHTRSLLRPGTAQLLVTFEYEQHRVEGPPFSVPPDEVRRHWPELRRVDDRDCLDDIAPKFRAAGLTTVTEAVWVGRIA